VCVSPFVPEQYLLDLMTFNPDIWHACSPWQRSSATSKVKVYGHRRKSVARVVVVGATSSEGFLVCTTEP